MILVSIFISNNIIYILKPNISIYIPNNYENTSIHCLLKDEHKEFIISKDSIINRDKIEMITKRINNRMKIYSSKIVTDDDSQDKLLVKRGGLIRVKNYNFCIIDDEFNNKQSDYKINIDYAVLTKGYKGSLKEINNLFNYDKIIISSSLSEFYKNRILSEADSLGIKTHDISKDGAFIIYE